MCEAEQRTANVRGAVADGQAERRAEQKLPSIKTY